jgi:hypothetical protein
MVRRGKLQARTVRPGEAYHQAMAEVTTALPTQSGAVIPRS